MGTPKPTKPVVTNNTPNKLIGGKDRRVAVKLWKNLAESVSRTNLLRVLIKEGMGLSDLEEFNLGIQRSFKSNKFQENDKNSTKVRSGIVKEVMKSVMLENHQN